MSIEEQIARVAARIELREAMARAKSELWALERMMGAVACPFRVGDIIKHPRVDEWHFWIMDVFYDDEHDYSLMIRTMDSQGRPTCFPYFGTEVPHRRHKEFEVVGHLGPDQIPPDFSRNLPPRRARW